MNGPPEFPLPRYFTIPIGRGDSSESQCVRCELCPRRCVIPPGETGRCGVRLNREGRGALPFYGFLTALAEDPIEKKPLYHFRPGSSILSVGFVGCNLHCPFCQNHHISQVASNPVDGRQGGRSVAGRECSLSELIATARQGGFSQIAYTYSEPLVHIEYLLDCMGLGREAGIANVLVSNGCVEAGAAMEILALTDAANIDLKCFSEETYAKILGGNLERVRAFIKKAYEMGVHLEVTTLVVPGLNDSEEELEGAAAFLAGISPDIPWHLSAYHPAYWWKAPPTSPEALEKAARRARQKLRSVYIGNVNAESPDRSFTDTFCPHCGKTLVSRRGYRVNTGGLLLQEKDGRRAYYCRNCGGPAPITA